MSPSKFFGSPFKFDLCGTEKTCANFDALVTMLVNQMKLPLYVEVYTSNLFFKVDIINPSHRDPSLKKILT